MQLQVLFRAKSLTAIRNRTCLNQLQLPAEFAEVLGLERRADLHRLQRQQAAGRRVHGEVRHLAEGEFGGQVFGLWMGGKWKGNWRNQT